MLPFLKIIYLLRGLMALGAILLFRAYGRAYHRGTWQEVPDGPLLLGLLSLAMLALIAVGHYFPSLFGMQP